MTGDAPGTFALARDWLERRGREELFFLFFHTYEVHEPYRPRDEAGLAIANALTPDDTRVWSDRKQYELMRGNRPGAYLPGRDVRRLEALHRGEVDYADRALGSFLESIDQLGLARDTIVVVTSDHGDEFRENGPVGHGFALRNRVLHVPLYFRWPGRIRPEASHSPVGLTDVMPTLLDLVGLSPDHDLDGRSLAPLLLRTQEAFPEQPAFSEARADSKSCNILGTVVRPCLIESRVLQSDRWKLEASQINRGKPSYKLFSSPATRARRMTSPLRTQPWSSGSLRSSRPSLSPRTSPSPPCKSGLWTRRHASASKRSDTSSEACDSSPGPDLTTGTPRRSQRVLPALLHVAELAKPVFVTRRESSGLDVRRGELCLELVDALLVLGDDRRVRRRNVVRLSRIGR
jgi:hypothetical protein